MIVEKRVPGPTFIESTCGGVAHHSNHIYSLNSLLIFLMLQVMFEPVLIPLGLLSLASECSELTCSLCFCCNGWIFLLCS